MCKLLLTISALPKQFALENSLFNKKCCVIIRGERQSSWNLRLATHNSTVHILGGWREFRVANNLNERNYIMFEVIANGDKLKWIYKYEREHREISTT